MPETVGVSLQTGVVSSSPATPAAGGGRARTGCLPLCMWSKIDSLTAIFLPAAAMAPVSHLQDGNAADWFDLVAVEKHEPPVRG